MTAMSYASLLLRFFREKIKKHIKKVLLPSMFSLLFPFVFIYILGNVIFFTVRAESEKQKVEIAPLWLCAQEAFKKLGYLTSALDKGHSY